VTYQTDKLLNPVATWGCYAISIYNMVEKQTGLVRAHGALFLAIVNGMKSGWLDAECTVLDPDRLAMSFGGRVKFLGKFPKDYATKENQYEILKFVKPGHDHFVLGDGNGKVLFNPLPNHDMTPYKLEGKRIFEVVK
jgi:hypothetical protein